MWRNDRDRRKARVSHSGGANRRKFAVHQLFPQNDVSLVTGADFDDFARHFFLEPKTDSRPIHQRLADRRVVHSPCDVAFTGNALTCSRTKLLEVPPRNIAAEPCSGFCSTPRVDARCYSVTVAGCGFVGITRKADGLPRLRIK